MKIAYNPKTASALTAAPADKDITFDLKGLNIFVRGERFKGTDTTYSVFKKHTSAGSGGYNGLVPVPSYTTTNNRFLKEDGSWSIPTALSYTLLTNQDLNNYLDEGRWYYAGGDNSVTNKPSSVDAFEVYVGRNANGYHYLKLITLDGIIWFRYYNATTWSSWVRWYTDQNTDLSVLQSATTTSDFRPVILGYTNTSTLSNLSATTTLLVYATDTIYAQPSTGSLWANKLYSNGKLVLTEHQSLANYVTLNTSQNITNYKTFSSTCLRVKGSTNYTTILASYNTSIDATLRDNCWKIYHSNGSGTYRGISIWSYGSINNEVLTISAYDIGSTLANPGNEINSLFMRGIIRANSTITGSGFIKNGSSNSYVLLGGGGHKLVSDFMLKTDELSTLTTITKSLNVTLAWMDTGITSTDLPGSGTYIVQVSVSANDYTGYMWNCYSSGVMSWYNVSTDDTETDEIILHRSGSAYLKALYLRTVMLNKGVLKLLIGASVDIGATYTYTFKFKRII